MIKLARRAGDDKVFSGWLHFYLGLRYVALTSLSFFTGADLTRIRHPRVIGTDIAQSEHGFVILILASLAQTSHNAGPQAHARPSRRAT